MSNVNIIKGNDLCSDEIKFHLNQLSEKNDTLVLAEGDSWFHLINSPRDPATPVNLLDFVDLPWKSTIFNYASFGSTLKDLIACAPKVLGSGETLSKNSMQFDLIMLSVGGNDIAGHVAQAIKTPAHAQYEMSDCLVQDGCNKLLNAVEEDLLSVVRMRDRSRSNNTTPIVVHTYDYLTPRNQPHFMARRRGPWIWRDMKNIGIKDPTVQMEIMNHLVDGWAERLMNIERDYKNFFVIDTRDTLIPADFDETVVDPDWHDEIHPTAKGFAKIADQKLNPRLREMFAARGEEQGRKMTTKAA